ncbi:MAG: hypothetical protein C0482_22845 [Gordonia sp.]|nr:hypothetical protein [Gordonia sp. (in: high G+C Gram-positive bacteria)]
MIHAGAQWAAPAAQAKLIIWQGGVAPRTPLGHTWVFGGGYVLGLVTSLVATSPTFRWRDTPEIRETIDAAHNRFLTIAERSVVIGHEHAIGVATITT